MRKTFTTMMIATAAALGSATDAGAQQPDFKYTDESFADIQMLRYRVEGFEQLTLREKTFIYYLQEAALQGRDILFDQNGRYNLRIRRALEALYTGYRGDREAEDFRALTVYLKRVWFSSGIHHHYGCDKFLPGFSPNGSARRSSPCPPRASPWPRDRASTSSATNCSPSCSTPP